MSFWHWPSLDSEKSQQQSVLTIPGTLQNCQWKWGLEPTSHLHIYTLEQMLSAQIDRVQWQWQRKPKENSRTINTGLWRSILDTSPKCRVVETCRSTISQIATEKWRWTVFQLSFRLVRDHSRVYKHTVPCPSQCKVQCGTFMLSLNSYFDTYIWAIYGKACS